MTSQNIVIQYIKKLNHPLKEIRERALQLLLRKFQLGWELEDELAETRNLLESLLAWLDVQKPPIQREAFSLLLATLKTKGGTYIAKELGMHKILDRMNNIKHKVDPNALETYDDLVETINFLNTVDSNVNVTIPPLKLHSETSIENSEFGSSCYNIGLYKISSKESSVSNEDIEAKIENVSNDDGIVILLYPWVDISSSDLKTISLLGDSLKVLKSTRRCCRFIRHVLLRDFPVEIFLNRPIIIKTLWAISDGQCGGHPGEALHALLCITKLLHTRFLTLFSSDLVTQLSNKFPDYFNDHEDNVNAELEQLPVSVSFPQEDSLVPLRQLTAPLYALETAHTILTIMTRSIVLVDMDMDKDVQDVKELNICLCLVESLIELLFDCVTEQFWSVDHTSKIHRDIAHKSCIVMRIMGELTSKYRTSFMQDSDRVHHRIAWLRLINCGELLLNWARKSALPPSSLVAALQAAHIDPGLELLYPGLSKRLADVLFNAKSSVDQEYKSKYRELKKLFETMDHAVQFMKINDTTGVPRNILNCIKNSLPILHVTLSENYLKDILTFLLKRVQYLDLSDEDWTIVRNVCLVLMAHHLEWVQVTFYKMLVVMVKSALMGDTMHQSKNEKCLTLICDVGILTELCCHGLSSSQEEVQCSANEVMLYILRGRMVLSDSCWWRLLASLLPVLPLFHVYAAHDTQLGKAICKSLEEDIVECMGVSKMERIAGLVRLMFVNCPSVRLDATHLLCRLLDDSIYLPPQESLRADVILNGLRRIEPQDFNVDQSISPSASKYQQASGLIQIIDVLKQDLFVNEDNEYTSQNGRQLSLEPSLRRSTLQQLAVMMRQQELHETFLQSDGLNLIVGLLRLSLMVDDYLAFPECAISCVSVLNSICFMSRHNLAKIPDLLLLLFRVILVFPANDNSVLMAAQVLALVVWAGFALQELNASRRKVPALPLSVTQRTCLPFLVNSYWSTSPNVEHSSVEWLLTEDTWRSAIRVRWWWVCGGGSMVLSTIAEPAPISPSPRDLALLKTINLRQSCTNLLLALENATSHVQVCEALNLLECSTYLIKLTPSCGKELEDLPWHHTRRFLSSPPASSRDTALLISLLQFIISYMDNVDREDSKITWIKSSFIGKDPVIISLLSRENLYQQETVQEDIEATQLRIHIVKILLRCILYVEQRGDYSCSTMESLLKILLSCLERIDLKNFHMLGYLNELIRCVRYAVHSRYCKISEDTIIQSLTVMTNMLSGCASGAGRKGQACRLDGMLTLLALLSQIREREIPVQRWSEIWSGHVMRAVVACSGSDRVELRAASLEVMAVLAYYPQLLPQLVQCIGKNILSQHAIDIFSRSGEANAVRAAAACLLTAVTARTSPHSQVLENELLKAIAEGNFIEDCLHIFVEFCKDKEQYKKYIKPNIPISLLERCPELEVRAQKSGEFHLSPSIPFEKPSPTPTLIASLADVIHNISTYKNAPLQVWNEQGLYRVLFRCVSWSQGTTSDVHRVRASLCRALATASTHKCVRTSLASTKDCLYNLLVALTTLEDDINNAECMNSCMEMLYFLSSLLPDRAASEAVWWELKNKQLMLFHLLLQALESQYNELQEASMHCIMQLARSLSHKKCNDTSKDEPDIIFFNNLRSPYLERKENLMHCAGDSSSHDCRPEYIVEEFCKILMNAYGSFVDKNKCLNSQDETWMLVSACLGSILSVSDRSRQYCVHRQFPRVLLFSLQRLRDALTLQGKTVDVIRNADNEPTLNSLNWVLTLISCLMSECQPAKERIADDIAPSLARLWPWCMMTEQLRVTLMSLLVTFTNSCSRAWASMCSCVGNRSLLNEVCLLVNRESARPRPTSILQLALRTLRHCVPHHHCRTIIIKSDVPSCICKLRARGNGFGSSISEEWTKLCEALAKHSDGAAAVLVVIASPTLKPTPAKLLPALAHAAHHQRLTFLQSPDLLELLSGCLLTGDTSEVVSAARAVWALAANNHRAKLVLRSAGVVSAVQSTVQRLQKNSNDVASQRAFELLTYTFSVLQTT